MCTELSHEVLSANIQDTWERKFWLHDLSTGTDNAQNSNAFIESCVLTPFSTSKPKESLDSYTKLYINLAKNSDKSLTTLLCIFRQRNFGITQMQSLNMRYGICSLL